jgi:hypothetical protein
VNVLFDGPLYKRSMNVNFVILIENGYVFHGCWKGDVLRETMNARNRWWRVLRMVALTFAKQVLCWI